MKFTGHARRADVRVLPYEISWESLTATRHARRAEKDGPGVSFAVYRPTCDCLEGACPGDAGHRIDENVLEVTALGLDIDKRPDGTDIDAPAAQAALDRLAALGVRAWVYSTHSATPEKPSLRAVIALSRPVPAKDWRRFWRAAVAHLGIFVQTACQNEARFWYLPSAPEGAEVVNVALEGQPLDVDAILARAPSEPPIPEKTVSDRVEPVGTADPRVVEKVRESLRKHGPAIAFSEGDQKTYIAACICRDYGLDEDQALEVMLEWNVACQPPWSETELEAKVRHAYRYAKGEEGERALEVPVEQAILESLPGPFVPPESKPGDPWPAAFLAAHQALEAHRGSGASAGGKLGRPAFTPALELFKNPPTATPWLIQGLVTEMSVGITSAEPKSIKTWLELENALAVATGTKSMGDFVTGPPRAVALFLAEDDVRAARNRLFALCVSRGLDPTEALKNVHVCCRQHLDITQDNDLTWIIASCLQIPDLALVVVDPLRDVHSADENDSTGMADVMGRLRTLRDIVRCSVRAPHHAKKETSGRSERGGQNMRGSSAIHGALDCGLYLDGLDTDGKARWTVRAHSEIKAARGAGTFTVTLEVEDNAAGEAMKATWTVDRGEKTTKITEQDETETKMLEVLGALNDAWVMRSGPIGVDRVVKAVGGGKGTYSAGSKKGTGVRGALELALKKDLASKTNSGWSITDAGKAWLKGPPSAPAV